MINQNDGEYVRAKTRFHGTILPSEVEKDRYHLFVSYACPWAHRTLITRKLKKLEDIFTVSIANPVMGEKGWSFEGPGEPSFLSEIYFQTSKEYDGKFTVPVLWDKKKKVIICNESSEIIRMMNSDFDSITGNDIDLYPPTLKELINDINDKIYNNVNNGVYKTGFASSQRAYEASFQRLFQTLDEVEEILRTMAFLTGDKLTEADIRLFTTLLRFDPVYYGHFKCNWRRIKDYHNLHQYLKCLYQVPEIKETCHLDHIKNHYYKSHLWINPNGIVPLGPELDLDSPHDRGLVEFHKKERMRQ